MTDRPNPGPTDEEAAEILDDLVNEPPPATPILDRLKAGTPPVPYRWEVAPGPVADERDRWQTEGTATPLTDERVVIHRMREMAARSMRDARELYENEVIGQLYPEEPRDPWWIHLYARPNDPWFELEEPYGWTGSVRSLIHRLPHPLSAALEWLLPRRVIGRAALGRPWGHHLPTFWPVLGAGPVPFTPPGSVTVGSYTGHDAEVDAGDWPAVEFDVPPGQPITVHGWAITRGPDDRHVLRSAPFRPPVEIPSAGATLRFVPFDDPEVFPR